MAQKYNPKRVTGSFIGKIGTREFAVKFQAYMDGEFINADYDEDAVTEHVGSDGEVTLVLNPNKKATLTLTLSQGSPSNAELSNLIPDADRNFLPTGVLQFDDLDGSTKVKAAEAWIRKSAPVAYSNAVTGRAWVFGMAKAEIKPGEGAAT